jgi:hypothetical protein
MAALSQYASFAGSTTIVFPNNAFPASPAHDLVVRARLIRKRTLEGYGLPIIVPAALYNLLTLTANK